MSRIYIRDQKVIDQIIRKAQICYLALSDKGRPYVIPMHFGYTDKTLYLHSGKKGLKMDILKRNPNVAFSMACDVQLLRGETACGFSANFRSVVGFGRASIIENNEKKKEGLSVLMRQYSEKLFTFPDEKLDIVAIIQVNVTDITARVQGYDK